MYAPYNRNARLMTTMFRQQLINCETFPHASPSEICLRPTTSGNVHAHCIHAFAGVRGKSERVEFKREKKGERERQAYVRCGTLFERASASSRDGKQKYTGPLCAQVECARVRGLHGGRVLASTYLHTSGPRKHLLKPTSFQTACVHFHVDSPIAIGSVVRSNEFGFDRRSS